MARIPLQSLVSSRQAGVEMSPGVFQQSARATSNLLASVVGASKMVKEQFDKAQDLRNKSEISEKRREIREAQGQFQNEMLTVDPAEWGQRWAERLKGIESSLNLNSSKTPPVVKRALSEDFQNFAGASYIQISGAALKANLKRAQQNFDRDSAYLLGEGDFGGNVELINQGVADGTIDEEMGADLIRATNGAAAKNTREEQLVDDPAEYRRKVKNADEPEYKLSPVKKAEEIQKADREIARREAEGIESIQKLDAAGLIENEDDLRTNLNANPNISKNAGEAYVRSYRSGQPLTLAEQQSTQDRIDANVRKFHSDPTYTQEDYAAEWNALNQEVNTYGSRTGAGAFRADLHNMRPSLFSPDSMSAEAAKAQAKALVPVSAVGRALVKQRADGTASIGQIAGRKENADKKSEFLGNEELQVRLEKKAIMVRSVLDKAMGEFIASFPPGKPPTSIEMSEFLDKNGDQLVTEAHLQHRMNQEEQIELKTKAEKSKEDEVNEWLNINEENPLLPPLPVR